MWNKKFVYVLNYIKTFKVVQKSNPQPHSLQRNKKAILATAAYFKVSIPIRSQWQKLRPRWSSFTKKGVLGKKQQKNHHHCILHIRISLGTKCQLKLTILIFWTKISQKGCSRSKVENVNTTIEFCIFELVQITNFSWN